MQHKQYITTTSNTSPHLNSIPNPQPSDLLSSRPALLSTSLTIHPTPTQPQPPLIHLGRATRFASTAVVAPPAPSIPSKPLLPIPFAPSISSTPLLNSSSQSRTYNEDFPPLPQQNSFSSLRLSNQPTLYPFYPPLEQRTQPPRTRKAPAQPPLLWLSGTPSPVLPTTSLPSLYISKQRGKCGTKDTHAFITPAPPIILSLSPPVLGDRMMEGANYVTSSSPSPETPKIDRDPEIIITRSPRDREGQLDLTFISPSGPATPHTPPSHFPSPPSPTYLSPSLPFSPDFVLKFSDSSSLSTDHTPASPKRTPTSVSLPPVGDTQRRSGTKQHQGKVVMTGQQKGKSPLKTAQPEPSQNTIKMLLTPVLQTTDIPSLDLQPRYGVSTLPLSTPASNATQVTVPSDPAPPSLHTPAPLPQPLDPGYVFTTTYHRAGHGRKLADWEIVANKQILFLGDSNLNRIPPFPHTNIQVDSYPGAKFYHFVQLLEKTPVNPNTQKVVLSVGINNKDDDVHLTSEKRLNKMYQEAQTTFPNATIYIPRMNFSMFLSTQQKNNLTTLNKYITTKYPTLSEIPYEEFFTVHDQIHWTITTADLIFQNWCAQLSLEQP